MNYLGPIGRAIKVFYSGINGATLTGAIDVIVVEDEEGNFKCTPFHVRFGKLGVLRSREKVVDLEVNAVSVPVRMKLGDSGEAFFVETCDSDDELDDENLATSPLPSSPQHSDSSDHQMNMRLAEQSVQIEEDSVITINPTDDLIGTESQTTAKSDDQKSRKRRRKRRKNQGSKSDIVVNMNGMVDPLPEEDMFKMDEDINGMTEALNGLDLGGTAGGLPQTRSFHRDFYSDTEVDASTPQHTRPSTPTLGLSDSEYEINKVQKLEEEDVSKWPWGKLPSTVSVTPVTTPGNPETDPPASPAKSTSSDDNPLSSDDESRNRLGSQNRSMLSSMFSFIKRNNRNKESTPPVPIDPSPGIYLDDLNVEDPAMAAIYMPQHNTAPKTVTNGVKPNQISTNGLNLKEVSGTSSSDESESGGGLEENKSGRSSRKEMHSVINIPGSIQTPAGSSDKYKKSMRLSSDKIRALGLKYGQNEAIFSVTTAYQGTSVARCHIYLWKYNDRVVVSDIDGTITKSDVLGHILPIIGNDWAQSGVAQLFTQIQDNGYKMLYLSARAIGQASVTREYLRSIKQGDGMQLPDGPLLLNPTSLMSALHREVIEKKPEEFKIACLSDVAALFPENPFYAGYGNKINDVWAYRAVGIPIPRIFTINHKGELRHALTNTFQSSYTNLSELVQYIFPVYNYPSSYAQLYGFNNHEYWRDPLPNIEDISSVVAKK